MFWYIPWFNENCLRIPALVYSEALATHGQAWLRMRGSKWVAVLLLALAGCGDGDFGSSVSTKDDNNHGYGWGFDETVASGLRVRYANNDAPRLAVLDGFYSAVSLCMGVQPPPGPLIIIRDDIRKVYGEEGATFLESGTILLDSQITTLDWNSTLPWMEQAREFPPRHEMVHHILAQLGFPEDRNRNHDSPYFAACDHAH
jgi:hypothetical protein